MISITCPANITTGGTVATGCSIGAVVNYPAPTVTSTCNYTVTCVPASGSTFPEGTTTVTCTATDIANNTATCTFTVTVTTGFGACAYDDFNGDTFQIVVDRANPLYGFWRYHVGATNETFCGTASSLSYYPGRSLVAGDTDDIRVWMNANLNYGSNAGTVKMVDQLTGRQFVLRDRNLSNDPPCQ
jgi:hypothetical protein